MKNKNILITGGSGLIGTSLSKSLTLSGYEVAILSRSKNNTEKRSFYWDPVKFEIDTSAIEFADVIIHLAGANVGQKKWTDQRKEEIIQSRVNPTKLLFDSIKQVGKKNLKIISASATGYYGNHNTNKVFQEFDPPGDDFLAKVTIAWENAVKKFNEINIEYNIVRTGVVLSPEGGALEKMKMPVSMGIGSALGSGKQVIPWIEISDVVGIYLFLIENFNPGNIVNAVAPSVVTNQDFMLKLAKAIKKPFFMPNVPAWVLKFILGEMAEMVTTGNKISAERIQSLGYKFKFNDIAEVFEDYFGK